MLLIESLERAIRVLDLFSSDVPEWTVSEVSRELDLPKTTAWEYMQTMTDLGLLRRRGRTHYRLAWRAFQIGLRARITSEIAGPARAEMGELVEKLNETVQLASRHGRDAVFLEKMSPPSGLRTNVTRVSERLPAHCTAVGKVLLAALPFGEIRKLFAAGELTRLTEQSTRTLEALKDELSKVREQGYAVDMEETLEGMCCVAVPVTNEHGDVAWALSMSFHEYRFETHAGIYAEALLQAAQRLSHPTIPALPSLRVPPVRR